jgi:quinol monooxygenase YgiN
VLLERYISRDVFEEHRATHFEQLVLGKIPPRLEARSVEAYDVSEGGAEYR